MQMPQVKYDVAVLKGGLDQATPTLSVSPGACRDAQNFECAQTGGYSMIAGYERFNGLESPAIIAAARYVLVNVSGSSSPVVTYPTVMPNISGATSGATGYLMRVDGDQFLIADVTGDFVVGETLDYPTSGTHVGVVASIATVTDKQDAINRQSIADIARAAITEPTGTGPIRGVFSIDDNVFCFRDVGANCVLYKAYPLADRSPGMGWTAVNYNFTLSFDTGILELTDGVTINGGTSGAIGVVKRVLQSNGEWGVDAAGKLVITVTSGTFQVAESLRIGATVYATCRSTQTQIVQTAGGKYQFVTGNFTGRSATQRIYGCDGRNQAFEFDGTTFCPIATSMTSDVPTNVAVFKNHLFLSFGSSLLNSGIGKPYNFNTFYGAAEIAVGETITGLVVQPGAQTSAAMAIYSHENIFMLYGTSSSSWNMTAYNTGSGAKNYSMQNMSSTYHMGANGVSSLSATLNYGNFDYATLTANILPFIQEKRSKVLCSSLCREKGQYRVFFNDGTGLYVTILNNKYIGAMPVKFPVAMNVAWESQDTSGNPMIFCGGMDGQVYKMESGNSFDGAKINAYITLSFNTAKSPRLLKRYRKAALEVQGEGYADFYVGYSLGYGNSEISQPAQTEHSLNFSGPKWDSFYWDSFTWDGQQIQPNEIELSGTAENIAMTVSLNNNYSTPFIVNSVIYHYTVRRGLR